MAKAGDARSVDVPRPLYRGGGRARARSLPGRRAPRGRGGRGRLPCLVRDAARRATAAVPARGGHPGEPSGLHRNLLARETGCSFGFGMFQMGFTPGLLRQAAAAAYAPVGEIIPSDLPGAMAMGLRQPVEVVGAIAPWNAALILSLRSIENHP